MRTGFLWEVQGIEEAFLKIDWIELWYLVYSSSVRFGVFSLRKAAYHSAVMGCYMLCLVEHIVDEHSKLWGLRISSDGQEDLVHFANSIKRYFLSRLYPSLLTSNNFLFNFNRVIHEFVCWKIHMNRVRRIELFYYMQSKLLMPNYASRFDYFDYLRM